MLYEADKRAAGAAWFIKKESSSCSSRYEYQMCEDAVAAGRAGVLEMLLVSK